MTNYDADIEIEKERYLLGPGDAYVNNSGNAEDQDYTRDDDQCVWEHLAAERDRRLRSHRLGWHHGCVNVDGVRSYYRGYVKGDVGHGRFIHD